MSLFLSHLNLLGLFHKALAGARAAVLLHDHSGPPAGGASGLRLEGAERGPRGLDDHPGAAALAAGVGLRARLDAAAAARVAAFQVADADLRGGGRKSIHVAKKKGCRFISLLSSIFVLCDMTSSNPANHHVTTYSTVVINRFSLIKITQAIRYEHTPLASATVYPVLCPSSPGPGAFVYRKGV